MQNARPNKEAVNEEEGSTWNGTILSLDTNIVNMTAEALNSWLTKFVEVYKEDGERYSPASDFCIKFTCDV